MRDLIEAVKDLDRDTTRGGGGDNTTRIRPRGEGRGPQEGYFWFRGTELVPVQGRANEIVNHAGLMVMLDPEAYGLTSDEIINWLIPHSKEDDKYSPVNEYRLYLSGEAERNFQYDPSHHALMWRASGIVFQHMLKMGWAWIIYMPPEQIHFTVAPAHAKFTLHAAAEQFPLLQIDNIRVTLATDFSFLNPKFPHMGKNKTLSFSTKKGGGFGANFNAAMDWASGKEAPPDNYLYTLATEDWLGMRNNYGIQASKLNVKTPEGYRKRFVIKFLPGPTKQIPEGMVLIRVPASVKNQNLGRSHWKGGLRANKKGEKFLYADSGFVIPKKDIEVLRDGQWTSY